MTRVWAHRGARTEAPENTLPAFERALDLGADGIEFDVRLTSDGIPVVIHDATVDRTTVGHGPVIAQSLAQLRKLEASAGMAGFRGVAIPTLTEVLDLVALTNIDINIELKDSVASHHELEEQVLSAIELHGMADRTVLSSFNPASLSSLQRLGATSELALILRGVRFRPWAGAKRSGASAIHIQVNRSITPHFVSRAHAAGISVRPWIVNSETEIDRMFRIKVDAIFTDIPRLAVEVRDRASAPSH